MSPHDPVTELDEPYSGPDAQAAPWAAAEDVLTTAEIYWITTVRPDGRPHSTPTAAVMFEGTAYFTTGPDERKARNLSNNAHCLLTTGCNRFRSGTDVILEGEAKRVTDMPTLQALQRSFTTKYDDHFGFRIAAGGFSHETGGAVDVYRVEPTNAFAYGRQGGFSATRFRF